MLNWLRDIIGVRNPLRLFYHRVWAFLAAVIYRFPSRKMVIIAATGTNGKTSVCNMIADTLTHAGFPTCMMTTVRFRMKDKVWANRTKMTTSGRFALQKFLRRGANAGCEFAVFEATSIAMDQGRLTGINVDAGIFTNLTHDHILYHKTFENYRLAKEKLYNKIVHSSKKIYVSNSNKKVIQKSLITYVEDPNSEHFLKYRADANLSFGMQKGDLKAEDVELSVTGTKFKTVVDGKKYPVNLKLVGEVSVLNALTVIGTLKNYGLTIEQIISGLESIENIPGRLEYVDEGQDFTVVVDYAHTESALEKILKFYKQFTKGRVLVVFGATGGGRDKEKRPRMGAVAERYADFVVVTNDDPYREDPQEIISQIIGGMENPNSPNVKSIEDRAKAVECAIQEAKTDDVVIIAGKGGEEVIVIGDTKIPYDDRVVARDAIRALM